VVVKFFITRPILAVSLLLALMVVVWVGVLALVLWQHLNAPLPTVEVSARYPGANAQVVADTVAAPIEQQVDGVEGMISMSRQITDNGDYRLTITFRRGTDPAIAQVLVQNRVALAERTMPDLVKRDGITVIRHEPR
jgi:multidrug efflux pump subunit AcrB